MIKNLTELDKDEKLLLLEAIARHEIDREKLTHESLFAFEFGDFFESVMIGATSGTPVYPLGDARKAQAVLKT